MASVILTFLLLRPRIALAIFAIALLLPGPLFLHLTLDNAPESYFPSDAPAVVFDRHVRETFPQEQVLIALFQGDDVYGAPFLHKLEALSQALEGSPLVERVVSVATADHIRATADGFAVEKLLGGQHISESASVNKARALSDPTVTGALVSRGADAMALILRPTELKGSLQRLALMNLMQREIAESGLESRLAAVGGHIALDVAQLQAMFRDLVTLIPGTLVVSMLVLWWLFRRVLVLITAGVCIASVTGLSIALLVGLGQPFTLITAMLPPLLTALTVAMLMHLYTAIINAHGRGLRGEGRMRAALKDVSSPILYTALTTACGLISLMASPIRPIAYFGLTSAVAIFLGSLLVVLVLPAIILRYDRGDWVGRADGLRVLDRVTFLFVHVSLRYRWVVLSGATLILIVAALQIPGIRVETDLYRFFRDDHSISEATATIEKQLSGVMPLEVVFETPELDGLKQPGRLAAVSAVQAWLDAHPHVDYTLSYPEILGQMHAAFSGEPGEPSAIPLSEPLVEQYLLFYDGRDIYDFVNPEFTRTRILVSLNVHGSGDLNQFLAELDRYLADAPPGDLVWGTAGMARLFADQERLLINGQVKSLYVVAIMITALMGLLWRSLRATFVSMVPNLAPVVLMFAFMAVFGIWLDMATAMVASVAIGIAIDDTIHVMYGTTTARAAGAGITAAIARTLRHRGRAIIGTTLILMAQFLLMAFSPFQPTAVFGALTALALAIALIFDLLVLPALLYVLAGPDK
jgi:predicted RND superfamily exporter protein